MSIGNKIAESRKQLGLTQDALAQKLGVTNQAVSKWESDQSCPDIQLLPQIADIFGLTIDELLGREPDPEKVKAEYEAIFGAVVEREENQDSAPVQMEPSLPWADDGVLRVVLYAGHTYIGSCPEQEKITFEYEGPALNIECAVNVSCGDVEGDVRAGGNVSCDAVSGSIQADGNVSCDDVEGHVNAGGTVSCDDVAGDVSAGGNVNCDSVEGSVNAGGNVTCDEIEGSVTAGGMVSCEGESRGHIHISIGDTDEDAQEDEGEDGTFHFSLNDILGDKKKDGKKKKGFTFRF